LISARIVTEKDSFPIRTTRTPASTTDQKPSESIHEKINIQYLRNVQGILADLPQANAEKAGATVINQPKASIFWRHHVGGLHRRQRMSAAAYHDIS
jgi:hypothetical protein